MKIAHLVAHAERVGGAEAAALAVAAAQAARGDHVSILHVHEAASEPTFVHVSDAASLQRALATIEPDVVHVHGMPEHAGALAGQPVVRSLHDYAFACASGERWFRDGSACERAHGAGCLDGIVRRGCAHRLDLRGPLRRYRDVSERLPMLRAEPATVVHSPTVRDAAIANGFALERVHLIPYFVSRDPHPAPVEAGRSFAFVGRIVGGKGLDVALRAFSLGGDSVDELHVVGDGWARGAAERLAGELGIAGRVRFHGWLEAAEVARVVRASRAVLLPSRWPEPFGIAGLEAAAVGRPVIASRVGGIPGWLDDGIGGLLLPAGDPSALADAMRRLSRDDELAEQLGRHAWRRAGRYSAAAHLAALDRAYLAVRRPQRAAA